MFCECGCGQITNIAPVTHLKRGWVKGQYIKFVQGHNARTAHPMLGKKMSPKTIERLREVHKGIPSPMAGKHHSEESRKKMSESHKGVPLSQKHRESIGKSSVLVWAAKSNEDRNRWIANISAGEKGKPPMPSESIKKMAAKKRGKRCSPSTEFTSERMKELHRDPVHMDKVRKALNIRPNKPEAMILNLLNEFYPGEWKYTGDFLFIINGKSPDFVNCNGQKKIIELFGDYWHRGQNPDDRAAVFSPFGYKTLIIWEHELKEIESVIKKIRLFAEAA